MMKLKRLLSEIPVERIEGPVEVDIRGITYSSAEVKPGYLFAAMSGVKTDGHLFIGEALKNGATAVLCEEWNSSNGELKDRSTRIQVEDSRKSFAQIASQFYHHPSKQLGIVGVTGTNGKTTTSFLIRSLMEYLGPTGLIGTVGNWIGKEKQKSSHTTPESSDLQFLLHQMKSRGIKNVVMEVSSHALAQERIWGTFFDTAVFTNLTQDHLEYHHTMESYFQAKSRLFRDLRYSVFQNKKPLGLVNIDDPWGKQLITLTSAEIWTYGFGEGADLQAVNIQRTSSGTSFLVKTPAGELHIHTSMLGTYNVYNLLAAVGVGIRHSIPLNIIETTLGKTIAVPGRLEKVSGDYPITVLVDYAHTEDALLKVLTTLQEIKTGRMILVFGCGGDRDKGKRPKMGRVAGQWADSIFLTSDNPRGEDPMQILREIEAGLLSLKGEKRGEYRIMVNRKEAIQAAITGAKPGDSILIAGKGHEDYQWVGKVKFEFDDRLVARDALQHRFGC
ncbi:MAG: UDP-N-acetylmuramoyl-L-alanyl-D-glutamate--2,6-diaminopimelate ligase [Nitrospirae bacterium]|nr:UDP-N-acetylmuramoyl-L-alanyl-D-glutamate--2,6-diaminopimelate ligase [Nitrospirota bacterium]MBI3351252.1 UDP-N-acetylmuramoyl-L-alanyl-D-glutamate--2,6-diaminopimelate ligase [Nitrospirota bacterium]